MGKLSEIFVEIASDKAKLDTGLNAAKAQITDFAGKANSLLGAIGIGIGGAAAVRFMADMTKKGSDLIETMGKVKVTFGESASVVTAMANDMADKFGAVKGVTLDAASNLGLVAQGAGLSSRAAAEMAVKLTRLADDASSFYNVPLDVALEKIRSGMVGEAEPLRAFGVLLSEDAVKARAAAMGIKAVGGELTEQEKVLARVKIITEGLAKAQGDHMRTMDGYANQLRRLTGDAENFKAAVGAGMAGAEASFLSTIYNKGVMSAIGQATMQAHAAGGGGPKQMNVGANPMLDASLLAAGAAGPGGGGGAAPEAPIFAQLRAQLWPKQGPIYNAPGMAGMNFMNALNFGGMGQQFNRAAMAGDLNQQIAAQKKSMNAWGGGHVMDSESFMRQAQEKILRPEDETAKKQLAELIKAREALDKLVGKQEGKAAVGKMILKGRES